MRNLLFFTLLLSPLVFACSSTSATSSDSNDGSSDAASDAASCNGTPPVCDGCCGSKVAAYECMNGAWTCGSIGGSCARCDAAVEAAGGDASSDSATCTGTPPVTCDGCCGSKYAADQCVDGAWTCPLLPVHCLQCDAAVEAAGGDASSDSGTCTGTRPNCFGNNSSLCCGNDPSGPAACSGGAWMCGSAPAPGCNGTSCLLQDAGPG